MPLATGCLDYEWKYELFTRNEIGAGAKYFQDSTVKLQIGLEFFKEWDFGSNALNYGGIINIG